MNRRTHRTVSSNLALQPTACSLRSQASAELQRLAFTKDRHGNENI